MHTFSKVVGEVVFDVFIFFTAAIIASGSCNKTTQLGGTCGKAQTAAQTARP